MIVRENLVAGYKALWPALNVKTLCLFVLGSHYVVDMKIINIVVRSAVTYGGLMDQTPNNTLQATLKGT